MDERIRNGAILVTLFILAVFVLIALLPPQNCCAEKLRLDSFFPAANVILVSGSGSAVYPVYIANTLQQQQQGYMNQTSLGDCNGLPGCLGMLFVFNRSGDLCFWMENTGIPLEQSWLDQNGIVTYVYNATPYSTTNKCAFGTMVLETQPGRIRLGDLVALQR